VRADSAAATLFTLAPSPPVRADSTAATLFTPCLQPPVDTYARAATLLTLAPLPPVLAFLRLLRLLRRLPAVHCTNVRSTVYKTRELCSLYLLRRPFNLKEDRCRPKDSRKDSTGYSTYEMYWFGLENADSLARSLPDA
jgi:hypothetical protein